VISNLQANSAYWRELAEAKLTQDLLDLASKQAATSSSENADILEDNENEEQKESTHETDATSNTSSH